MGRFSKTQDRNYFLPKTILDELSIKGRIGGAETKRLLAESCHAYIRLQEAILEMENHAKGIIKVREDICRRNR